MRVTFQRTISLASLALCSLAGLSHATLVLGLDARSISQGDGTPVALWDSTGSGGVGNANQSNPAWQPTFVSSSTFLNGNPAVSFNDAAAGQDVAIGHGMLTTGSGLVANYTVMVLYAYRSSQLNGHNAARIVQGSDGVNRNNQPAGRNWLIGPYNGKHVLHKGGWIPDINAAPIANTAPVIATAIGSGGGNHTFWLNGVSQGTAAGGESPGTLALGTHGAWAEAADSDLGLVLAFDTQLTDDERIGIEALMAQAYGLPGFSATPAQLAAGQAQLGGFIPEPASASLFCLGGLALLFRRRRN